jgi:hypothetical protein
MAWTPADQCCAVLFPPLQLFQLLCTDVKQLLLVLQTPTFNEHLASLQAEMKLVKQANTQLTEDHKVQQFQCISVRQLL